MATDIGRINAAMGSIRALDYKESETYEAISKLIVLLNAVECDLLKRSEESQEVEVAHPDFLRCAADYQDAPNGTKVAKRFGSGWWRKIDGGWMDESCTVMPGSHIATAPREVLKWGGA